MNELIERLVKEAGITPEQATKAIEALSGYVKEKFPMLGGAVDNLLGVNEAPTATATSTGSESSIMDKISDVIPGETGEKVEEFAKNAAHKAEEVFGDVKEKLSGLFGGEKK